MPDQPTECALWLLDEGQAAVFLGTSGRHIRHLWQTRQLSARKIGRKVRFAPEDLRHYADRHTVDALR
jgi:excisionase family DNA binding protein